MSTYVRHRRRVNRPPEHTCYTYIYIYLDESNNMMIAGRTLQCIRVLLAVVRKSTFTYIVFILFQWRQ